MGELEPSASVQSERKGPFKVSTYAQNKISLQIYAVQYILVLNIQDKTLISLKTLRLLADAVEEVVAVAASSPA